MKSIAYAVFMIMLAVAMVQAGKSKRPKFCLGKNNIKYEKNEGYTEGCTQFICVKKGKKFKMMSKQVPKCEDGVWSAWSSYSACSASCGPATKSRTRTCSNPAPANGGKPCPGLNQQTMDCQLSPCGESEPDLAANVTAIEASMQFLNESMESIESKFEALQSSVESILGMMTTMQSTSKSLETNISSNMEAINTNKKSITKNEGFISVNKDTISTNNAALAAKDKQMEMNITSTMEAINTNKQSISTNNAALAAKDTQMETNIASNMDAINTNKKSITKNEGFISVNKDTISTNNAALAAKDTQMGSCLADITSSDCPPPASGKTSVTGGISANTAALADKCDASTCSDIQEAIAELQPNVLVLTGGSNDATIGASSEVISPEGVCSQSIPPLPYGVTAAESVFIDDKLMLCGGYNPETQTTKKKCHFLETSTSQWEEGPEMKIKRKSFSLVKVGYELFAIGGSSTSGQLDSIEKYSGGQWKLLSQTLSSPKSSHCSVYWSAIKSLVTIGGYPYTNKVETLNVISGQQTVLTPLPVGSLRLHNCIVHKETILVVGGLVDGPAAYAEGNVGRKNTVWKYNDGTWEVSGHMKAAKEYHSINVLDGKLLVVGSYAMSNKLKWIERMNDDETWEYMPWSISGPRSEHAVVAVPARKFPCLT